MTQSYWQDKFENFEILTNWVKQKYPTKKLNKYRLVKINNKLYYEVQTQKSDITFLCDIKHFNLLKKFTFYSNNTFYIETKNKRKNIKFHRLLHPEWKITDHINRNKLDNRECNLRQTTQRENMLNRKLSKNNSSNWNSISLFKNNITKQIAWTFRWYENNKRKAKYFYINKKRTSEQAKQQCITFKLEHNKIVGNLNGYNVEYV